MVWKSCVALAAVCGGACSTESGEPSGPIQPANVDAPDAPNETGFETLGAETTSLEGIYLSPTGDDSAAGTEGDPLRTFAEALSRWSAGKEIRALTGVYSEQLIVAASGTSTSPLRIVAAPGATPVIDRNGEAGGKNILLSGKWIHVEGFEVRNSSNQCVDASGQELTLSRLVVHDCVSHGVQIRGQNVTVSDSTIYHTVLENEGGGAAGWGSALKVAVAGNGVVLERNRVLHNWGEGIAVTRGANVVVRNNWSYDNWAVNIYIDNSYGVDVDQNLVTCSGKSAYERDGNPATGIAMAEEYYAGWGAQLSDVRVRNNIVGYCHRSVVYWGADVPEGGLKNVSILHNTLWGSNATALSIAAEPFKTQQTTIANNLIQQPRGNLAWIENPAGIDLRNNFWAFSSPSSGSNANGPGDRVGDPGLAFSPGRNARSYRLSSGSPCRDHADSALSPDVDFEGKLRSTGASPGTDMGAMEFGDPNAPSVFDDLWTDDLIWFPLYGSRDALADKFSHPADWSSYGTVRLWVRRIGLPEPLSVRLMIDSRGIPGFTFSEVELNAAMIGEFEPHWFDFDLSGGTALIGSSSYLVVWGSATDDDDNHWEIGVDLDGGTAISHFTRTLWYPEDVSTIFELSPQP